MKTSEIIALISLLTLLAWAVSTKVFAMLDVLIIVVTKLA